MSYFSEVEFRIISADAENVIIHFELSDAGVCQFAAQVNITAVKFDFSPQIRESFAVEFNITFAGGPMGIEIGHAEDLALFAVGKLIQYGRTSLSGQRFAIESDAFFSDSEGGDLFAVGKVKVNFSALDERFAVKRFTNDGFWYIIIPRQNHSYKIV